LGEFEREKRMLLIIFGLFGLLVTEKNKKARYKIVPRKYRHTIFFGAVDTTLILGSLRDYRDPKESLAPSATVEDPTVAEISGKIGPVRKFKITATCRSVPTVPFSESILSTTNTFAGRHHCSTVGGMLPI
jgi:hypothetical protein